MTKNALIIGNYGYKTHGLTNPGNDATDLKEALEGIGVSTILKENLDRPSFAQTIKDFSKEMSKEHSEVIIFFYAGHGIQIDNTNYLCPVDFDFSNIINTGLCSSDREAKAKIDGIQLDVIIEEISRADAETKIFILDSCRNNPASLVRGVSQIGIGSVIAPKGTLIAFSTSPGGTADDFFSEGSRNSAFTYSLLQFLSSPGLKIEDIFKRTRVFLAEATKGKQISWEHSSLMGDLILVDENMIEKYSINYSLIAKSDEIYQSNGGDEICEIIRMLKSHNWYLQNPAISKLKEICLTQTSIDMNDLFVIGRNVYQAACGNANDCLIYIRNLDARLQQIGEFNSFHLLNGILFEIFFDRNGALRSPGDYKLGVNQKKVLYQYPILLIEDERYRLNKLYIQGQLSKYPSRIFYSSDGVSDSSFFILKLVIEEKVDIEDSSHIFVRSIEYKGSSILYSSGGQELISIETNSFVEIFISSIKLMLAQLIVCPECRLELHCDNKVLEDKDIVYIPKDFQIRRTSSPTPIFTEDIRSWYYL